MVEIAFNKKRAKRKLIYGLFFLILSILFFVTDDVKRSMAGGYVILGVLFLIKFYIQTTKPYVIITEETISKFSLFKRKVFPITAITSIKDPNDDFVIRAGNKEMIIDKIKIDEPSHKRLKTALQKIQRQRGY